MNAREILETANIIRVIDADYTDTYSYLASICAWYHNGNSIAFDYVLSNIAAALNRCARVFRDRDGNITILIYDIGEEIK